ncbi:hypothetical protein FACS189413_02970 [Bacteroidia bacterium]|nr:hypothetical protein FACS189413_02970 [Bacteroidia bacterium]
MNPLKMKDMRKMKNIGLFLLLSLFIGLSACEDEATTDNTPSRLFRPANLSIAPDRSSITWTPIKGASYQLEYGRNTGATFETAVDVQTALLTAPAFAFPELWGATRYTVRIKSVGNDPAIKDSEFIAVNFTTLPENIIVSYLNEIGNTWINLHWLIDATPITRIHVEWLEGRTEQAPFDVTVASEEAAAGSKRVEGLVARSKYKLTVYSGERMRGSIELITER